MRLIAAVLALCLAQPPAAAGTPEIEGSEAARLDAGLAAMTTDAAHPVSSVATILIRDGQVVYEGAAGWRDMETKTPATPDTLFRMASVSKMVTAIGYMKLVDGGKADLDRDVSDDLGFRFRNPAYPDEVITARMLLSHTASLRDPGDFIGGSADLPLVAFIQTRDAKTGKAAYWSETAAESPAQRFFSYANMNFVVIGTLIERISGRRFDRYMAAEVLRPLGIPGGYNAHDDLGDADIGRLATLYRRSPDSGETWNPKGPWVPQGPDRADRRSAVLPGLDHYHVGDYAGIFGPQGGLRTSVKGLSRLMRMLMNGGSLDGVTILQPATVQAMMTPAWRYDGSNGDTSKGLMRAWGLGLQIFTDESKGPGDGDRLGPGGFTGVGHLGDAYGLFSGFILDPARHRGMVYAIGGQGADPSAQPARASSYYLPEERLHDLFIPVLMRP